MESEMLMRWTIASFLLSVLALGVRGQGDATPPPSEEEARIEAAIAQAKALPEVVLIFVAEVQSVGKSQGIWCGFAVTRQHVTWSVRREVLGKPPSQRLELGHLLVYGSEHVEKSAPYLRPDLIYPGAAAVLAFKAPGLSAEGPHDAQRIFLVSPPRRPDPDHVFMVQKALSHAELRVYAQDRPEGENSLITVELGGVVPIPVPSAEPGLEVQFRPPEMVGDAPAWRFERILDRDGTKELVVTVPREGVHARFTFSGSVGRWSLSRVEVAEK